MKHKRQLIVLLFCFLMFSLVIASCQATDTSAIEDAEAKAADAQVAAEAAEAALLAAQADVAASEEEIAEAKAAAEAAIAAAEAAQAEAEAAKAEAEAAKTEIEAKDVAMTEVGTPRHETLIFQTIDRQTATPDLHNPLMFYAYLRGFRELGWGWLWETDTGTGETYGELADGLPEVLNEEHTEFRIHLKEGIYWSDGVEFTADDVIYTLDAYKENVDTATWWGVGVISNLIESYNKVDTYTFEVKTVRPTYDLHTTLGVYTFGSPFNIVPKHIFEKQENVTEFLNTYPVTLGPYVVKEYDPNGFWQLWELREDWQRSSWGWMDKDGFMPKYILYKDFGPEELRTLAFVQNEYDVDTFMSPDSIKAAQTRNEYIKTFSDELPYHNMDDACSWGVMINQHKAPLDKVEVRWALALMLDLKSVGLNALNGEFKVSPLSMVDSQVLRPIYFEPLLPWVKDFTLSDGYKPFDENFVKDLAALLQENGIPESEIPDSEEARSEAFGVGWWKYDPAEAEKLLNSVGITKNVDGIYTLPDGSVWELELVIPSDWNKVLQRVGFSIVDSWKKGGIQVNARQVDSAEFGVVEETNAELETMVNWINCIFTPNYANGWLELAEPDPRAADEATPGGGNRYRWSNETVVAKMQESLQMDTTTEEFYENGRIILMEFVKDMAFINLMNIATTCPTNEYYWTGFPHQDNYYAVPYSWWSSAKEIVANIEPTGNK